MQVTLSILKADVGSVGGHTKPSARMLDVVRNHLNDAIGSKLLIDGNVTHTGDDIAMVAVHRKGAGASDVHRFAWDTFMAATDEARSAGLYGAGQDLLTNAPSGNIRGAGPAVAEIDFELDPESQDRPAEAFLIFAADKCGPGAYNYPLYSVFCDPMHSSGLLLNPKLHQGFTITVMDMDHKGADRVIELDVPERIWDVACLLQDPDRYAIEAVTSRYAPDQQIASVSTTRLHTIAGKYTGKDDPVAIVRTQGIFPAPEEVIEPYTLGHFVAGDCRGSHVMPIMPVPINSAVAGPYALPMVSCMAYSMDANGKFSNAGVDIFGNSVWDATRNKVQQKTDEWRRQGCIGPTMASRTELSYTGIVETRSRLEKDFVVRPE